MLCCDVSNNHLAIPRCCVSLAAVKIFQEKDSWLAACRHLQSGVEQYKLRQLHSIKIQEEREVTVSALDFRMQQSGFESLPGPLYCVVRQDSDLSFSASLLPGEKTHG